MKQTLTTKVRLTDIAKEAGVSLVTVSKVLNKSGGKNTRVGKATAQKIESIARRLNYVPDVIAQQLAGQKSRIIGVLMDSCAPLIYNQRLSSMEMYAARHNYKLMVGQTHENCNRLQSFAREFTAYGVAGIICMAHSYPVGADDLTDSLNQINSIVFADKPSGNHSDISSVSVDIEGSYEEGVNYLFSTGRKRIGLLLTDYIYANQNVPFPSITMRENGYLKGIKSNSMEVRPELIQSIPLNNILDESAYSDTLDKLVRKEKVDAIMACNDEVAAMVIRVLTKMGKIVPGDVAVVGYDNINISQLMMPQITTFDQKVDLFSQMIVELMISKINGKTISPDQNNILIKPELIVRSST